MKSSTLRKTDTTRKTVWLILFSVLMLTLAFAALLAQDAKARAWLAAFAQQRAGDGTWLALPLLATASSLLMVWLYRTLAQRRLSVRWARVSLLVVLFAAVALASLYVVPVALGHNLETKIGVHVL